MILVLLSVLFTSNTLQAQTDEEEEEDGGFFSDGMNSSRFESSFGSSYENSRPTYEYKSNRGNERQADGPANYQTKELDIEVDRHQNYGGSGVVIGGGGGGGGGAVNTTPNNGVSAGANTNVVGTIGNNPPIKRNVPNSSFPDNPGDPDAPIDGGVGFLIAAGLGFGLKKLNSRKK